ncbi:MAG TPA: nuclear transport factor 2 family protein [Balneolaceae bacterium]|nr:nuclear transport factor 2 family protein [Balneolaceae bacterium]
MKKQDTIPNRVAEIESIIEHLNHSWLNKEFVDLETLFHKEVVLLQPGNTHKKVGREMMIESYEEFMDSARVSDFKVNDKDIEVFANTAVAYYTYRIHYRVESTNYDETGSEVLVFNYRNDRWIIVWRMQLPIL